MVGFGFVSNAMIANSPFAALRSPILCANIQPDPQPPQIPEGAHVEPTFRDNCLSTRLASLTFGYETSASVSANKCLRYRCRHGHVVTCKPGSEACHICPTCSAQFAIPCANLSRRKLSICQLKSVAKERNGHLLSTTYVNARTPLAWACEHGHVWKATASNIRSSKSWCPECARLRRKLTIQDMRALAKSHGGECLSDEYISEHVKLRWRCAEGHEFLLAPNNVKRKPNGTRKPSWCKLCRRTHRKTEKRERVVAPVSSSQHSHSRKFT